MKDMSSAKQILGMHIVRDKKRIVIAITRKVCDKGAPKIRHGKCETGGLDTTDKLQAK